MTKGSKLLKDTMRSRSEEPAGSRSLNQRRLALWKAVVGVAAGVAIACGALLVCTYGPLSFDAWPKTLAITLGLGSLGSLYALSKIGTVILVLRELWLARVAIGCRTGTLVLV